MRSLALLILLLPLTGCALTGLTGPIDVGGLADAATDRHAVWGQVEARKLDAIKSIAAAEQAKAEARRAARETRPIMHINDAQSMAIYQLGEANRRLAEALETVAEVAMTAASGGKWSIYTAGITFAPQPRGAFAEFFDSILGGAADVLHTPAAGIVAGGWALDKVLNNRPPGYQFNGEVHADQSFNMSEQHITGSSGANAALSPYAVRPEVVEQPSPVIVGE